ncbi:MAG: coniferyl aldehyde dehydrogenase [Gammaproteobacteria bacterium]|nr:coniferyl aldehyde dehydrogenase [Gammaproteobacteria bacterium]
MTIRNDEQMETALAIQKAAAIRDGMPPPEKRTEWLDKSIDLLCTHGEALCDAMSADFGHRSKDQSTFSDISGSIEALKYAKKHLRAWMRPEKRSTQFPLGLFGARASVHYQPKGVVGIISPWNFPVNLTFGPLAGVFAAGNRAMIKPSEFTERTSQLMAELFSEYYSEEEVVVVTGGPEVGATFSRLPFDHMVFTGATSIAHHVMRAAADNLVPVTLELGGKSPVVIGRSADLQKAALRIMVGKTLNGGQICLAPDYAFLPEGKTEEFIDAARAAISSMFPSGLRDNDDYTSIVNQRHFDRLQSCIDDARSKGAEVIEINPNEEDFEEQPHYKVPPTIIVNATDEMKVMQDEIFGPILPIRSYTDTKDVVAHINARPRPLGLYYFGSDTTERDYVLHNTTSGGVTVNDVFFHVAQEDLPFGGIGPSGMGAYHGKDGFDEFSHRKAVYTQAGADIFAVIRPPYGEKFRKFIGSRIKP